jgi:glutathione reductase (NADPH)
MTTYDYDLFVIGAGSGGLAASKRAASYGAKVAIAESDLVGGTCVIRGCVPKKLLLYASKFSHLYHDSRGYGWQKVKPSLDWVHLMRVVDREVRRLSKLHISFLEKAGVELIHTRASFVDEHTLDLGDRRVTAAKILIAVGGRPVKPDLPGMEHAITSNEMFLLPEQPKSIAIIGAGYIGTEFAGIMQGLGSDVTQIIRKDLILKGFDEDIRTDVQTAMANRGIHILTNRLVTKIEKKSKTLKISLVDSTSEDLENGSAKADKSKTGSDKADIIKADVFLAATGRIPNVDGLGLENVGITLVPSSIEGPGYSTFKAIGVDEFSRTSQPHIFAVGDCTDRLNLTPVAIAEGRAFADTEFGNMPRSINHENVPSAVFSQPEAATVGLSETAAKAKFGDDGVEIFRAKFRPMFHSLTGVDEKVTVKLVVERATNRVLGAHMVGENAAEVIQGMAIAVKMGATKQDFDATIGIHPSTAEEFVTLR